MSVLGRLLEEFRIFICEGGHCVSVDCWVCFRMQRLALFDSGYIFTSVYGDVWKSRSFTCESGHPILRSSCPVLLVRSRSTGNWIWFDSGSVWIYWEMTSGNCLRDTLGFVPARVSLRNLQNRFTQNQREGGHESWRRFS